MIARVLCIAAFLANVAAFAPAGRAPMATMRMGFASGPLAGMPGADGPESKNFDPSKFAESSPEWVPWFREAELKHGRIAMLAAVGWLAVDLGVHLPGAEHAMSSLEAHTAAVQSGAMIQILIWTSIIEICTINAVKGLADGSHKPGDYAFNPLNFGKNPKDMAKLQVNELKNGRLAMLAFSGMVTQAALTGHGFPYLF